VSWQLLPELARRERELVTAERWDDLLAIQAERDELIAALPERLPHDALVALEAALRQSRDTESVLRDALGRTGGLLRSLRHGRKAVTAYSGPAAAGLETRA
jgi:hypothetical protein